MPRTEQNESERRRNARRNLQTRVALKTDRAIFFMESVDISIEGMRVESEVGVEVGTKCRLIPFFDDIARLFEAEGTVVRTQELEPAENSARPHAAPRVQLGIRFEELSSAELEALLGILRRADAPPQPLRM